jgi:predicted nicotinamide N-methyase
MLHAPAQAAPPPQEAGYLTKMEIVHGHGEDVRLRSLLDRLQYHDPDGDAERAGISPASWPIFGLLWPSSQALAGIMGGYDFAGKRVLEVGCGLALASLVAHRRGADITASDCHPLAGPFLIENLRLNGLASMKYEVGDWAQTNPALGLFDVIIGSDVLYDRGQPEILSQFISRHSQAQVEVLIMDPDRGNQPVFSRKMGVLGYVHTVKRIIALPDGSRYKGRLHTYSRE